MNDWWDYLEHGQLGEERKGHKYYARVAVGKNKFGFTQYRYFYDAREYGAYMSRKNGKAEFTKNNGGQPSDFGSVHYRAGKKHNGKTTYYVTGTGPMLKSKLARADMDRSKRTGEDTVHVRSDKNGAYIGASASASAKTVKDHKKLRKAKRDVQAAAKKGKEKVASLLRKAADKIGS